MRDTLVTNSSTLAPNTLNDYAHGLYLDMAKFRECLDGHNYRDVVRKEIAEATALKIEGTPTFVIGKITPEGVDGVIMVGALPFAAFDARLKELASAK